RPRRQGRQGGRQGAHPEGLPAAEGRRRGDPERHRGRGRREARGQDQGARAPLGAGHSGEVPMGSILLVAEIQKGGIREASYELVTFAKKIGGDVSSVVIGSGIAGEAEALAKSGGGKVYVCDDAALANYNVDGWAKAVRAAVAASGAETVLFS